MAERFLIIAIKRQSTLKGPIPKRLLATSRFGKLVVYSSLKTALRINSSLNRPWVASGIWRSMSTGRPYLGWRFRFLDWWEPDPEGSFLAIDTPEYDRGFDYVQAIERAVARINDEPAPPCELALRRKAS